ncbi:hypothetical protein V8G54_037516 [Vigna mungo]|uniref:Uncharacterized protein n=1 Tax=Vigna mungo TaxID=3915 RepID=A0AAQ3MJ06_VIGMU
MPSSQILFLPQNNPKSPLNLHRKPLRQSVVAFVLIQTSWTPHLHHQSRTTMEACSFAQPVNKKPRIAPLRKTPKSGYNRKIIVVPGSPHHEAMLFSLSATLDRSLGLVHRVFTVLDLEGVKVLGFEKTGELKE